MSAILVINKIDAVSPANIAKTILAYSKEFDFDAVIPLSAKNGKGERVSSPKRGLVLRAGHTG